MEGPCASVRIIVVLILFGFVSSCVTVKPWERAVLADPCMAPTPDPEEAKSEQHLFSYREGSAGGYGDSGGGCGCN